MIFLQFYRNAFKALFNILLAVKILGGLKRLDFYVLAGGFLRE